MIKPNGKDQTDFQRDGDTEQKILDAAHSVFLRRGTSGARMQEIASEAGVNKALLHYYFRSKERLAEAVFQRVARGLIPPLMQVLASEASIEEKVHRIVHMEIDHLERSPLLPGYIISELHQNPERAFQFVTAMTGLAIETVAPFVTGTLRNQIDERVKAGTMLPIAPEQFVINVVSLCVFPFAIQPMLSVFLGINQSGFEGFMTERRKGLSEFILRGIGVL